METARILNLIVRAYSGGAISVFMGLSYWLLRVQGNAAKASVGMIAVGAAMMVAGGLILKALADATKAAIEYDTAMRPVATLTETTADGFVWMKDQVLELSRTVPKSANDLADALYFVKSVIEDDTTAMGILGLASKASSLDMSSTADTARVLTSTLSAYGGTLKDVTKWTDQLVMAVSLGHAEFGNFASQMGPLIGFGNTLGVTFGELATWMAFMTKRGYSASAAGVAIKNTLMKILNPAATATKMYKEMGIQFGEVGVKKAGGLIQWLTMVGNKVKWNTDVLRKLFPNLRSLPLILAMATDKTKGANSELKAFAEQILNASGTLEERFDIAMQGVQNQMQLLSNGFDEIKIRIGTILLPLLSAVVGAITPVVQGIAAWIQQNPGMARILTLFLGLLGTVLLLAGAIVVLVNVFKFLAGMFAGFTAVLAVIATVVGVILAVVVVAALMGVTFQDVGNIFAACAEGVTAFWNAIVFGYQTYVAPVIDLFVQAWQYAISATGAVNLAVQSLTATWQQLQETFKKLWAALKPVLAVLGLAILGLLVVIGAVLSGLINALAGFIAGVVKMIAGVIRILTGLVEVIVGIIQTIVGLFVGIFTGNWDMFNSGMQMFANGITDFFFGIADTVMGFVDTVINTIAGFFVGCYNFVASLTGGTQIELGSMTSSMKDAAGAASGTKDGVKEVGDAAKTAADKFGVMGDDTAITKQNLEDLDIYLNGGVSKRALGDIEISWRKSATATRDYKDAWEELKQNHPKATNAIRTAYLEWQKSMQETAASKQTFDDTLAVSRGKLTDFTKSLDTTTDPKTGKTKMQELTYGMRDGFVVGMVACRKEVRDAATQTFGFNVQASVSNAYQINSPSKVMARIGKSVGEGMALGIYQSADMVQRAADSLMVTAGISNGIGGYSVVQQQTIKHEVDFGKLPENIKIDMTGQQVADLLNGDPKAVRDVARTVKIATAGEVR
jgi:TP901 family phage tail tape measure protein